MICLETAQLATCVIAASALGDLHNTTSLSRLLRELDKFTVAQREGVENLFRFTHTGSAVARIWTRCHTSWTLHAISLVQRIKISTGLLLLMAATMATAVSKACLKYQDACNE